MKKIKLKLNQEKKKKLITILIIILIMLFIICSAFYITNTNFRSFFDRYIFGKEIGENNANSIDLNGQENVSIYAYDKYITVLNKNVITAYTSNAKKEYELELTINNAIYSSNSRYLAVAEHGGKQIYFISEGNILWQKQVEDEISDIKVNKNGYVSVILTGNTYKTIVTTYSPAGKELFTTYLSTTTAIDTAISNDNKYLAIAEINTSGTLIQSNIKIISIEKAQNDPLNSVIYTYNAPNDILITSIQYQNKNKLAILCHDEIITLQDEKEEIFVNYDNDKITFANVQLNDYVVYTVEKSAGMLSSNTQVVLKNTSTGRENIYTSKGVAKDLKTYNENVALNLGSEIHFITTNGWLNKKYILEKEVKDIVIGDKIAGIIYQDKIDIINI